MQSGKRKYYRLAVESPCVIKVIREGLGTQSSPSFKGMLKDVSLTGLLINIEKLKQDDLAIFPEMTKPGQKKPKPNTLAVKFSLPHEENPFVVRGQSGDRGEKSPEHLRTVRRTITRP